MDEFTCQEYDNLLSDIRGYTLSVDLTSAVNLITVSPLVTQTGQLPRLQLVTPNKL